MDVRARFRHAQRVQAVLSEVDGVTSARIDDEVPLDLRNHEHRGDFLVQALDLRLRISLLVGTTPENAALSTISERAAVLLEESPDADAVVLVFDDPELTSVVVEPFDLSGAVAVPTGEHRGQIIYSGGPAALSSVLDDYLRLLGVRWQPTTTTIAAGGHDIAELASDEVSAALDEQRQKIYRVPEKVLARDSLSEADATWLTTVVVDIARHGEDASLEERIRERGASR